MLTMMQIISSILVYKNNSNFKANVEKEYTWGSLEVVLLSKQHK